MEIPKFTIYFDPRFKSVNITFYKYYSEDYKVISKEISQLFFNSGIYQKFVNGVWSLDVALQLESTIKVFLQDLIRAGVLYKTLQNQWVIHIPKTY